MPNRFIKESIATSETLAMLIAEEERHFWRLIIQADDFGRFDARPHVIRAKGYAAMLDQVGQDKAERWTQGLVKHGLIQLYQHEGRRYGYFPTWSKHQQTRAHVSKFPDPLSDASTCYQPLSHAPVLENDIRERERKRVVGRKRPRTTLQKGSDLLTLFSEEERIEIDRRFLAIDMDWEAEKCVNWNNDNKGGSVSWKTSFANWLNNAKPNRQHGGDNGRNPDETRRGVDPALYKYMGTSVGDKPRDPP